MNTADRTAEDAADRAEEYGAAAEAWRAFCATHKTMDAFDLSGAPVCVVLLAGLATPLGFRDGFTGDLITDIIAGATTFVDNLDLDAQRGGGGGNWIEGTEIDALSRRLNVLAVLRSYERAHREHVARKLADDKRGATASASTASASTDRPTQPAPAAPVMPDDAAERARAYDDEERARNARDVADLGAAALTFACSDHPDDDLHCMPLAGVLFLAMVGTSGERAEVDPPLLLALCSLRATVNGWIDAPRARTDRASVSLADVDLFARRLDATIEIARRGDAGRGAP